MARMRDTIVWLDNLRLVGGFTAWATHASKDVHALAEQVGSKKWREAKRTATRLSNAADLKWGQFRINALVLTVATDQLKQVWRPGEYRPSIDSLLTQVRKIDEAGFKQPVCDKIVSHLETADVFLSSQPADGSGEQFKAALRNAMSLF